MKTVMASLEITLEYIYIYINLHNEQSKKQQKQIVALCIKHKNSTFTYIQRMTIFQISTVTIHKFYELIVMLR
jgi:hypothetical protein